MRNYQRMIVMDLHLAELAKYAARRQTSRPHARVRAYDPVAMDETRRIYGVRPDLELCASASAVLEGADALAICTEWQEFRSPDFALFKTALKQPVVFDGRNLYEPSLMAQQGIRYFAIGRGERLPE